MRHALFRLLAIIPFLIPTQALPQAGTFSFGGDQFASGQAAQIAAPVVRDAFIAGYDATLSAPVGGDAHLAGFNVSPSSDVAGDLYAAGFSVSVTGGVGGDLTAMGNSVSLAAPKPVAGNARIAGQTVTLSSEVDGSALIAAQTLTLSAPVKGDLRFVGENLSFGPNARVDGVLTIQAPREIAVPTTVASADRVKFEQLASTDYVSEAGKTAEHVVRGIWPAVWAMGLWWLLLFAIGLVAITLLPRLTRALQVAAETRPFRRIGVGLVTFAAVLGLVPVLVLTVVGIFLLPFALVFVVLACVLAYLAGAYLIGSRISGALVQVDTNLKRVGVLAASILLMGLLGLIPVIGWLITLIVLCFGFGVIAAVIMARLTSSDRAALAAVVSTPEPI